MLKHFVVVVAFIVMASAGLPAGVLHTESRALQGDGRQEPKSPQTVAADPSQRDQHVQVRYNIFVMEGVLERAVAHGADRLRRQVRRMMPNMMLLSGDAQARGFRLDGYGVFFDVSVPVMRQGVAWTLRTMISSDNEAQAGAALQQLKAAIERMTPDAREKAMLLQAIKRLEMQVGPSLPGGAPAAVVTAPGERAAPPAGTLTAMNASPTESRLTAEESALLEDPNGAYEREVIGAVIDAMLNHSNSIGIGADEWLTVAAHDTEHRNRLAGEPYDLLTIVLRVKGSDLAAFRAERLTLEEARKRVQVSEF